MSLPRDHQHFSTHFYAFLQYISKYRGESRYLQLLFSADQTSQICMLIHLIYLALFMISILSTQFINSRPSMNRSAGHSAISAF